MGNEPDNLEMLVDSELQQARENKREEWNKLEYYLLNLGASVGFGCVWRFCYLMYDGGGGAFLIPYILMNVLLIYPAMTMFVTIGQFSKFGMAEIYRKIHPKYTGLAYVKCVYSVVISGYYNYLLVYNLIYLVKSLFGNLSWISEDPGTMINNLISYFHDEILQANDSGKVVIVYVIKTCLV